MTTGNVRVQVEWHADGYDTEIEIGPDGVVSGFYHAKANGPDMEHKDG